MSNPASNLRKRTAEFIASAKADALENSRFLYLMNEVPMNKLLGMGALTGLGATGLVVNGAELLTPNEAEEILSGEAVADDREAGYGMLLSSGLLAAGAGLTADEYLNRVRYEEALRDEVTPRRAAREARKR